MSYLIIHTTTGTPVQICTTIEEAREVITTDWTKHLEYTSASIESDLGDVVANWSNEPASEPIPHFLLLQAF